jgi:protein associated with RNAse G/E
MFGMSEPIKVLKKNLEGRVTWQYEGQVLGREQNAVVLEAFFNHSDLPFMDVILKENDRFVETFYTDRWYNIFEIYDRDDGRRKGWYCNVGRPAVLSDGTVSYVDLALDLWVSAEGKQTVLDEAEFVELSLDDLERENALNALAELQQLFTDAMHRPEGLGKNPA